MKKDTLLYLISFAMDACAGLTGLGVPLVAMEVGATYDDLGAIGAIGSLTYSLGCFLSGPLADRVGYRRVMTFSSLGMALTLFSYLAVEHLWHLFVLSGAGGAIVSGFWPPLQAWLGKGKGRRYLLAALGRFNVCWSLGFLIGPVLSGLLYTWSSAYVFGLGAVLVGLIFLGLLLLRVEEGEGREREAEERLALAASRRFLPIAWVANFATFFAIGTVRSLFPKFATDLAVSPGLLGWLMALIGLAQVVAFPVVSRTTRWQFRLGPLAVVQFSAAIGLGLLAFGTSPAVFAVGLLLQGGLVATTFTASIFYSLYAEGGGGRRTGIHEGIVGSGFLVGPLAGGWVAEHLGPQAPYLIASAVVVMAVGFQACLWRREAPAG